MYNSTIKSNQLENLITGHRGPAFISKMPLDTLFSKYSADDNGKVIPDVGLGDFDRLAQLIEPTDCKTVSVMSLEGLFRGYSGDFLIGNMPKFERPVKQEIKGNAHDYSPWVGHSGSPLGNTSTSMRPDLSLLSYGSGDTWPTDGINTYLTQYDAAKAKGVGFAGPMVMVGWGYDLFNRPVPNNDNAGSGQVFPTLNSTSFLSDHRNRSDMWKAGPIDLKWCPMKKVWTFPYMIPGKYNGNGTMTIWAGLDSSTDTKLTANLSTFFNLAGIPSGTKVLAYPVAGELIIHAADC